jgi:hypothetical protein
MNVSDALLFAYDALGGAIRGKTTLQKKIYFLGIMLNEDFGYGAHYYGLIPPVSQRPIRNSNPSVISPRPKHRRAASIHWALKLLGMIFH